MQLHFVSDRVVAEKGRPCYEINAGEKGETTTVIATFNAMGQYSPPMVIFKGKRLKSEWCVGSSAGTLVRVSDNGRVSGSQQNSFYRVGQNVHQTLAER